MNLNLSIVPYIPLLMNFDKDKFLNEVKDTYVQIQRVALLHVIRA